MGNKVPRMEPTVSFDVEYEKLPYRPVMDAGTGKALRVCEDFACDRDEVVWEAEDIKSTSLYCSNRAGTEDLLPGESSYFKYHTCSKVTCEDCPVLGGMVEPLSAIPLLSDKYDAKRRIRCSYDRGQLAASCAAATEFGAYKKKELKLQPFDNWFDSDTMNILCAGSTSDCPKHTGGIFPTNEDGDKVCSQLVGCRLCKTWALSKNKEVTEQSDNMMIAWCDDHPTDPSCRCIKRMQDPLYQQLIKIPGFIWPPNAGCWWHNCADSQLEQDLVPSTERRDTGCPTSYCADIFIASGGTVDMNELNQHTSCSGAAKPEQNYSPYIIAGTLAMVAVSAGVIMAFKKASK